MPLASPLPLRAAFILTALAGLSAGGGEAVAQCGTSTLFPSGLAAQDYFGDAVATKGNTIVVGARGDDNARGQNAGAVYIYTRNNSLWGNTQQIIPADTTANSAFGKSVAIDNRIIVGANNGPFSGNYGAGAAYVCPTQKTADFNNDQFTEFFDYDDFVTAFEQGC